MLRPSTLLTLAEVDAADASAASTRSSATCSASSSAEGEPRGRRRREGELRAAIRRSIDQGNYVVPDGLELDRLAINDAGRLQVFFRRAGGVRPTLTGRTVAADEFEERWGQVEQMAELSGEED